MADSRFAKNGKSFVRKAIVFDDSFSKLYKFVCIKQKKSTNLR
jgi:hypothetical protein